jgi:hypothetical protein
MIYILRFCFLGGVYGKRERCQERRSQKAAKVVQREAVSQDGKEKNEVRLTTLKKERGFKFVGSETPVHGEELLFESALFVPPNRVVSCWQNDEVANAR